MDQKRLEIENLISKGNYIEAIGTLKEMLKETTLFRSFIENQKEPEKKDDLFQFLVFKAECYLFLGDTNQEVSKDHLNLVKNPKGCYRFIR